MYTESCTKDIRVNLVFTFTNLLLYYYRKIKYINITKMLQRPINNFNLFFK